MTALVRSRPSTPPAAELGVRTRRLGFRLEKLVKKAEALSLFQSAVRLAEKGSSLEKLARAQVDRVGKP